MMLFSDGHAAVCRACRSTLLRRLEGHRATLLSHTPAAVNKSNKQLQRFSPILHSTAHFEGRLYGLERGSFRLHGYCYQKHRADKNILLGQSQLGELILPCIMQLQRILLDRPGERSLMWCKPREQRVQAAG